MPKSLLFIFRGSASHSLWGDLSLKIPLGGLRTAGFVHTGMLSSCPSDKEESEDGVKGFFKKLVPPPVIKFSN